jgi:hypothetical protein
MLGFPTFTVLEAAGQIKEDDGFLCLMQGLDQKQAEAIADWLALATGGPVSMRYMDGETEGWLPITRDSREQVLARLQAHQQPTHER